jgi:HAD superfamily hydrolase (TIGR01459 family)
MVLLLPILKTTQLGVLLKMINSIKNIHGISSLVEKYQYFILDIWGVLHDGTALYPQVLTTLQYLKKAKKTVCLLSNAPRRSEVVTDFLTKIGIDKNLYSLILTSGEAVYLDLQQNQHHNFHFVKQKYCYAGPKKDQDLLMNLSYQEVDVSLADFILNTGFDNDNSTLSEKIPLLNEAKKHNLPMICANPDLMVVKQSGQKIICAGVMAKHYEELGGEVFYYGKPKVKIYEILHNLLEKPNKSNIIAVGDGLETDILGANNFQIDSVLVTGGILTHELKISFSQNPDLDKIKNICQKYSAIPNYTISNLYL